MLPTVPDRAREVRPRPRWRQLMSGGGLEVKTFDIAAERSPTSDQRSDRCLSDDQPPHLPPGRIHGVVAPFSTAVLTRRTTDRNLARARERALSNRRATVKARSAPCGTKVHADWLRARLLESLEIVIFFLSRTSPCNRCGDMFTRDKHIPRGNGRSKAVLPCRERAQICF